MKKMTTIGYGVNLDEFNKKFIEVMEEDFNEAKKRIEHLLKYAPKKKNEYDAFVEAVGLTKDSLLDEYDAGCSYLDFLICDVVMEIERLNLDVLIAGNGVRYLIYTPKNPWEYISERGVSKEFLARTFYKYMKILVGEEVMQKNASEWIGNHEYNAEAYSEY